MPDKLAIADAICAALRVAYRVAAALHIPTDPVYRAYVRAVRRANGIYWSRYAESIGDTNYAERHGHS